MQIDDDAEEIYKTSLLMGNTVLGLCYKKNLFVTWTSLAMSDLRAAINPRMFTSRRNLRVRRPMAW